VTLMGRPSPACSLEPTSMPSGRSFRGTSMTACGFGSPKQGRAS
jgi:hypothetical protein